MKNNVSFVGLCQNGRNEGKKVRREVRKREEKWRRNEGEWGKGVTLVTAKKQHRCWKARTHTRV